MIDRLELLVPAGVPKRLDEWQKHTIRPAKTGMPYAFTLDADRHLALRVHYDFRVPIKRDKRHFKVDFTDTRLLGANDIVWRLTALFDTTPSQAKTFRVARIDFTADVYGVPVEWFKRHCRVQKKRTNQIFEVVKSDTKLGKLNTITFGKRPNLYRIYDRIAERRNRGAEILYSGLHRGDPPPVVTRIERQCSGKSIPESLSTLGGLFTYAANTDPFPGLVCDKTSDNRVSTEGWTPQKWLMNEGLAAAVKELGEATVRARLNKSGNANRYFSQYSDLLRAEPAGVTVDFLREVYRKGTIWQLNLPVPDPNGELRYPQKGVTYTL